MVKNLTVISECGSASFGSHGGGSLRIAIDNPNQINSLQSRILLCMKFTQVPDPDYCSTQISQRKLLVS
jgi:hypothetical protein